MAFPDHANLVVLGTGWDNTAANRDRTGGRKQVIENNKVTRTS